MNQRLAPAHIALVAQELAIAWTDGVESFFGLETLRRACPCAVCQGEADVTGHVERPERHYTDSSFDLKGYRIIGGYALQLDWKDGHGTGLYSFQYLRQLASLSEGAPS